ncbi:MAG: CvpA family protein [Planctomycetota bacterium]|nr:CvpA family protein [Planctomycetota bacterium]
MQVYDIIMLVVLVGGALFGAWKGMAWQLASVSAIVLSYIEAVQFRDPVAAHIEAPGPWDKFLAMLLLYVGTSLVVWIAFRMVAGTIEKAKLKSFDSQMGALVGLAKGVLLCVVITLFAVRLLGESERTVIINSHSGYYIAQLLHRSKAILPEEISKVIDPYIHNLNGRLQEEPPDLLPQIPNLPTAGGGIADWLKVPRPEGGGTGLSEDSGRTGNRSGPGWLPGSSAPASRRNEQMPSENFTQLPGQAGRNSATPGLR